jgi:hypothetical protein
VRVLVAAIVVCAEAAEPGVDVTQAQWADALATELVALPDTEARRVRLAGELAATSDPERAARIGDALAVVLAGEGAEAEVLHARLVLALSGEAAPAAPAAPPARSPLERDYFKRALEVRTAGDGTWEVVRVSTGRPVSARSFADMTDDKPVNGRLRRARVLSYVGAGVLGGCAVISGYMSLNSYFDAAFYSYDPYDPYAEPTRDEHGYTKAVGYAALGAGCVASAIVLPVATAVRQRDVHHYYDEARAREVVEGYDAELRERHQMPASEAPRLDVWFVAGLDGVGVRGTF